LFPSSKSTLTSLFIRTSIYFANTLLNSLNIAYLMLIRISCGFTQF
jgi:hypothetical protein